MLERYNRHLRSRHLDIGVGTGWYLDRAAWPVERPEITLLDLNENSLSAAARRLARYAPQPVRANVLEPLPLERARFESAAVNYLFHCLPGSIESKAATVAANVRPHLAPGGALRRHDPRRWDRTQQTWASPDAPLQREGHFLECRGR